MSKLTPAERAAVPASEMGLPEKGAYPMPDKQHAIEAKSGAAHAEHVGNITPEERARIDARANRILGKDPEYESAFKEATVHKSAA